MALLDGGNRVISNAKNQTNIFSGVEQSLNLQHSLHGLIVRI